MKLSRGGMGNNYTVATASGGLYKAGGATDDYAKNEGVKFVATVELPDRGLHGPQLPESQINGVCEEFMEGLKVVAEIASDPRGFVDQLHDEGKCLPESDD